MGKEDAMVDNETTSALGGVRVVPNKVDC